MSYKLSFFLHKYQVKSSIILLYELQKAIQKKKGEFLYKEEVLNCLCDFNIASKALSAKILLWS